MLHLSAPTSALRISSRGSLPASQGALRSPAGPFSEPSFPAAVVTASLLHAPTSPRAFLAAPHAAGALKAPLGVAARRAAAHQDLQNELQMWALEHEGGAWLAQDAHAVTSQADRELRAIESREFVGANHLQAPSAQRTESVVRKGITPKAASERLGRGIQLPTLSDGSERSAAAFVALRALLQELYPSAHATLNREIVGEHSLLFTWPGTNPDLPPIMLMGHQDVVPVEPGTEGDWEHPPFSGAIAEEKIWGRGAVDAKVQVFGILEAVEQLTKQGFQPERTVLLAFGHDEETGGREGAKQIAALLQSRGIRPAAVLDEGTSVTDGFIPGVERPIAVISTGEKGYVSVKLTARADGGHSSVPGDITAIDQLVEAVRELRRRPMRANMRAARQTLKGLKPELPFFQRLALSLGPITRPLVKMQLKKNPVTNALIRTTTAPTILNAGVQDNVLPQKAEAVLNFRILPGDTVEDVLRHVRERVGGGIEISTLNDATNPPPVAKTDSATYGALKDVTEELFPTARVIPGLFPATTDSRHYASIADNVYRFLPLQMTPEEAQRIHSTNEALPVDGYMKAIEFYGRFIQRAASR